MASDLSLVGRRLLRLANVTVGLAAACIVVALYVLARTTGEDGWRGIETSVREGPGLGVAALLCALLLLVDLLYAIYGRTPRSPLRHVLSDAPGGVVRISRDALEAGLRAAGEELAEITRLRVGVGTGAAKRVVVSAHFYAPPGTSIQQASQRLREALTRRFEAMVRLVDGARLELEIEFAGFAGKPVRAADDREAGEEAPAFRGPEYPIDDEASGGAPR